MSIHFDPKILRAEFPIFSQKVHGHPLAYLDNAATSQKPQSVLNAMMEYYTTSNANVHRGIHFLGDRSTTEYHRARQKIAQFFGAPESALIATSNTTDGMNLLAESWARAHVQEGDVMAVSLLDHHSNFVPWQQLALEKRAEFVVLPVTEDGEFDFDAFAEVVKKYGARLKIVATPLISNVLGVRVPVEQISELLVDQGLKETRVITDVAQAAAHIPVDIKKLGADALVFSGHKMYGPMGIGGVVVSERLLSELQPSRFGGGMIARVAEEESEWAEDPIDRFAAGTPNVAGLVGLAAAVEFLENLGWGALQQHEAELVKYCYENLQKNSRVQIVGPQPENRIGSVAFTYDGVHAHDVAQVLDRMGVAVRSGHHCAMPLHTHFGWTATVRASFAVYNTREDVDQLIAALAEIERIFS